MANYFSAEPSGMGLFDEYGLPRKTFRAMAAVGQLAGRRLPVGGVPDGIAAGAADKDEVVIVVSRTAGRGKLGLTVESVPWPGPTRYEVEELSAARALGQVATGEVTGGVRIEVAADAPAVVVVKMRAGAK